MELFLYILGKYIYPISMIILSIGDIYFAYTEIIVYIRVYWQVDKILCICETLLAIMLIMLSLTLSACAFILFIGITT